MSDVLMDMSYISNAALSFRTGSDLFEVEMGKIDKLIAVVSAGALLGASGEMLVNNLKSLKDKLKEGADEFMAISKELNQAQDDVIGADTSAKSKFKS